MALISKDALLHGLAEDYIEVTGDSEVTFGNFREKNRAALESGGGDEGYGLFSDSQDVVFPLYPDPSGSSGEIHE